MQGNKYVLIIFLKEAFHHCDVSVAYSQAVFLQWLAVLLLPSQLNQIPYK